MKIKVFFACCLLSAILEISKAESYCANYEDNIDIKGHDVTYTYDTRSPLGFNLFSLFFI